MAARSRPGLKRDDHRPGSADRGRMGSGRLSYRSSQVQLAAARPLTRPAAHRDHREVDHAQRSPNPDRTMRNARNRPGHTRNPEDGIPLRRLRRLAVHRQAPPVSLPGMWSSGPGRLSLVLVCRGEARAAVRSDRPYPAGTVSRKKAVSIVMRPLRHGRPAVAAEVAAHDPVTGIHEDRPLRIPHPAVAHRGMQQDQRGAGSGDIRRNHYGNGRPGPLAAHLIIAAQVRVATLVVTVGHNRPGGSRR